MANPILAYCSLDDAELYFSARLNTDAWDNATQINRIKALAQATRDIDKLNFAGAKLTNVQELQFPRGNINDSDEIILGENFTTGEDTIVNDDIVTSTDTMIPDDIKWATCEIALDLLDGKDLEMEIENLSANTQGYSTVRTVYERKYLPEHLKAGIINYTAWCFLLPYLRDPRELSLVRVN